MTQRILVATTMCVLGRLYSTRSTDLSPPDHNQFNCKTLDISLLGPYPRAQSVDNTISVLQHQGINFHQFCFTTN